MVFLGSEAYKFVSNITLSQQTPIFSIGYFSATAVMRIESHSSHL